MAAEIVEEVVNGIKFTPTGNSRLDAIQETWKELEKRLIDGISEEEVREKYAEKRITPDTSVSSYLATLLHDGTVFKLGNMLFSATPRREVAWREEILPALHRGATLFDIANKFGDRQWLIDRINWCLETKKLVLINGVLTIVRQSPSRQE